MAEVLVIALEDIEVGSIAARQEVEAGSAIRLSAKDAEALVRAGKVALNSEFTSSMIKKSAKAVKNKDLDPKNPDQPSKTDK